MSCCIQFLKWNALSFYFYLENSFSKNITSYTWFSKKMFLSQTSFLLLSSDTHASFANKPIKFCGRKPNTWWHVFVIAVYVLPSKFSYTTAFFCCRSFFQIQRAVQGWWSMRIQIHRFPMSNRCNKNVESNKQILHH